MIKSTQIKEVEMVNKQNEKKVECKKASIKKLFYAFEASVKLSLPKYRINNRETAQHKKAIFELRC